MKATLRVVGFDRFQHYGDRKPIWIKLYNSLLDDYDFAQLEDAARFHLVAIWLLASRTNNEMPDDARWISRMIGATSPVNIDALVSAGFIERYTVASETLVDGSQVASLEKRRVEKSRAEQTQQGPLDACFVAEPHRVAYHAYRQRHRLPEGFDATLRSTHAPITGGVGFPWAIIGQALHDMAGMGADFTPITLRRCCERLTKGTDADESPAQRSVREALAAGGAR